MAPQAVIALWLMLQAAGPAPPAQAPAAPGALATSQETDLRCLAAAFWKTERETRQGKTITRKGTELTMDEEIYIAGTFGAYFYGRLTARDPRADWGLRANELLKTMGGDDQRLAVAEDCRLMMIRAYAAARAHGSLAE